MKRRKLGIRVLAIASLVASIITTACQPLPGGARGIVVGAAGMREQQLEVRVKGAPGSARHEHAKADGGLKGQDQFVPLLENEPMLAKEQPLSTFSVSVDTASYSIVRRMIERGDKPPAEAVRIADLVNYFEYDYAAPGPNDPNAVIAQTELAPCPWKEGHYLLRVGMKSKTFTKQNMPPRNLVFLVDLSGSMSGESRLPLVQKSLRMLVDTLDANDRVSLVTYAGSTQVELPATAGNQRRTILKAIDKLTSGGSTNGESGIKLAYQQAESGFIRGGVNRVILCTDGDFNVGISSEDDLMMMIESKRRTGIYLTVLGYGMGNLKDNKLETLAHHGNGHYAYIDRLEEAEKLFKFEGGSMAVVAKDVKLQMEFNPELVNSYRLIGYENRLLKNEDFRNDAKDAGDMGSGHSCTAIYEVKLTGRAPQGEMPYATFRFRYKHPETEVASEVMQRVMTVTPKPSVDHQFASAVVGFGMMLRQSEYRGTLDWKMVIELAKNSLGQDAKGYRADFVEMVEKSQGVASNGLLEGWRISNLVK